MQLPRACLAAIVGFAAAANANPEPPEPPAPVASTGIHLGLAFGAGTAYDGLGLHLEVRGTHLGVHFGTGVFGLAASSVFDEQQGPTSSSGFCAGVRWFRGDGEGLFISLNVTWASFSSRYNYEQPGSPIVSGTSRTATAVIGGRARWGHLFAEGGLGAGAIWLNLPPHGIGGEPAGAQNEKSSAFLPDISVGLGVEF